MGVADLAHLNLIVRGFFGDLESSIRLHLALSFYRHCVSLLGRLGTSHIRSAVLNYQRFLIQRLRLESLDRPLASLEGLSHALDFQVLRSVKVLILAGPRFINLTLMCAFVYVAVPSRVH